MTTREVLKMIKGEGGFNNWRHWSKREVVEWVQYTYLCSKCVATRVAEEIY